MPNVSKITLMLIASLLLGCAKSTAKAIEQQRAASILFDQFETVFYAKADLLSSSSGYKQLSQQDANLLRVPFADLLQALQPLGKQVFIELFSNVDFTLVGAKDFHAPEGPPPNLGGVQSHFCYVLVLANKSIFEINKVASKHDVMTSTENGVWKWSAQPTEGHSQPYTFYVTQIDRSYLLISNNLNDIHVVSSRLGSNISPDLSNLRDWQSISQHEAWGYRRYRHSETNKTAAGTSQVTPDAQALAFLADFKQKTVTLKLFSPTTGTADKMNETGIAFPFKASGSGVWEARIPLTGDQKTSEQLFAIMSWFGFGVYV